MLSFFGFLLTTIQYMQRINMSVGIVCMINNTRLEELSLENKAKSLIDQEFKNLTNFVKNETIAEHQCAFTTLERSLSKVYFVKQIKKFQCIFMGKFFIGRTIRLGQKNTRSNIVFIFLRIPSYTSSLMLFSVL